MQNIVRILGWLCVVAGSLLIFLGILSWPPGGLMFALPYFFLIPGCLLFTLGMLLLLCTRSKKNTPYRSESKQTENSCQIIMRGDK